MYLTNGTGAREPLASINKAQLHANWKAVIIT